MHPYFCLIKRNLKIGFSSLFSAIKLLHVGHDKPVVSDGGNRITRLNPSPNPKLLATFSLSNLGLNKMGFFQTK